MQFDSADAAYYQSLGLFDDIVTHELAHVLGFGGLWNYGANPLVSADQYTGSAGLNAYREISPGATYIPVETTGESGTVGAHWSEALFDNELMTGWIDSSNYLSKFSVASLGDLGYAVSYSPYTGLGA
jgi:hypothetical protein